MKTITKGYLNADVCVYELTKSKLRACFFKEKPEIGDTFVFKTQSFKILSIDKNRDTIISKKCVYDPTLAYFELTVKLLN